MELDTIYRTKEEVDTMLAKSLERERQKQRREGYMEGRSEGRSEGHAEGHAEGRADGERVAQRKMILQLLQWRFDLTETEQMKFAQQLAELDNTQQLTELINGLLREELLLDEFAAQLAAGLTNDRPE